jgi:hypothetical protein
MALKPDRNHVESEIGYFCNDVVNRGVILIFGSSGSGVSLDQTQAIASLPGPDIAPATGVVNPKPLGVLMNDMVNVDLTHFHMNFYKDVMPVGGKCTIWKRGWVVTDQVRAGITPVAGDLAYLAPSGQITNVAGTARVGSFLSAKDEKGFVKFEVNLP